MKTMDNCIICKGYKPKNQPYRCIKCYSNIDNDKEIDKYIKNQMLNKIEKNQKQIDPEIQKIINEDFWDLI